MGLSEFSADLQYTSVGGCEYQSSFKQNPKNPDANKVLLDVIEHLAWMVAIGGQSDEAKLAFDHGHMQGTERRAYLDSLKESEE